MWLRELEDREKTIQSVLETSARLNPDAIALSWKDQQITYRQLLDLVTTMTHFLQSEGIAPNDTVVLIFQSTLSCIIAFLALARLNTRVIPLEPETTSYNLESIFEDIPFTAIVGERSKIVQVTQPFTNRDYSIIDVANLPESTGILSGTVHAVTVSPDSVFLYHYTSGSTGKPKAALHSQANLVKGGMIYKQTFRIHPEDRILLTVPLAHSFGMIGGLVASLVSGSRLVLIERFVPRTVMEILSKEKITILIASPLIYAVLARITLDTSPDLSKLRVCLSSGARLSPSVAEGFRNRYGKMIFQVYGSTETGAITAHYPRDGAWPESSVGCPLKGVEVRIVDDNGHDLPPNKAGNILVMTSTMFTGYHGYEATVGLIQNGWYITGDVGWVDSAGHLYLSGRKDTFINVGGKKVNPHEVEEVLLGHPMVKEALVYGKDAGTAGEQVQAALVLSGEVSVNELIQFCRERLAFYKTPCQVKVVEVLPKTRLGKVRRNEQPTRNTGSAADNKGC